MNEQNSAERDNRTGALVVRASSLGVTDVIQVDVTDSRDHNTGRASYDARIGSQPFTEPTAEFYHSLMVAFRFFNVFLFAGLLPECLITVRRTSGASSQFSGGRFVSRHTPGIADEIALDSTAFSSHDDRFILSMLAREMTHLWQHHLGRPASSGYCNREWSVMMERIGLVPSSTGQPGGRRTGRAVGHYIEPEGPFDQACRRLQHLGVTVVYEEEPDRSHDAAVRDKKAASKTRYSCSGCGLNVWGKPGIGVICAGCATLLVSVGS